MNIWKRALMYITRKRNKSILLFFVFLFMGIFVLLGLGIQNASEDTAANLRERLGGYFRVRANNGTTWLDDAFMEKALEVEGVKEANAMNVFYLHTELILTPGRFATEIDPKYENQKSEPRFLSNTKSELYEYFLTNAYELVEGEHVNPGDKGKVLISERLAQDNNLTIGSRFTADVTEDLVNIDPASFGEEFEFEVAGIYKINSKREAGAFTPECDIAENYIFVDMDTGREINDLLNAKWGPGYEQGIDLFVNDPKDMQKVIDRVVEMDENRDSHFITVNDVVYQSSAAPLERIGSIMTVLIVVVLVVSVILLSLILTMWIKERVHEIGIYLSIGIRKGSVTGQFIVECVGVFLAAFLVAILLSAGISRQLSSYVTQSAFGVEEEADSQDDDARVTEFVKDSLEIKVAIGGAEIVTVALVGLLVVIVSVGFASITVVRLKPKDILTRMS